MNGTGQHEHVRTSDVHYSGNLDSFSDSLSLKKNIFCHGRKEGEKGKLSKQTVSLSYQGPTREDNSRQFIPN